MNKTMPFSIEECFLLCMILRMLFASLFCFELFLYKSSWYADTKQLFDVGDFWYLVRSQWLCAFSNERNTRQHNWRCLRCRGLATPSWLNKKNRLRSYVLSNHLKYKRYYFTLKFIWYAILHSFHCTASNRCMHCAIRSE